MMVGVLTLELAIFEARTLKEKRRVIQSVSVKLRNGFNASVAEVGHRDAPQRCRLGVAVVSHGSRALHSQMDKIVDMVRGATGLSLLEYTRELV